MTDHRRPALAPPNRRLFLLLLTLAAFGWRIVALDFQSLWRDEVDAIYFAVRDLGETLSMIWRAGQNGPLYFLSLRPWFGLVGTSEFALRFPSTAFSTLSVLLTFFVAERLLPAPTAPPVTGVPQPDSAAEPTATPSPGAFSPMVPWLAALLMAANPYQVWYAQEGKMYAAVTLLALVASWFWLRGMAGDGRRFWWGYWATVTVAMYTHLLMILLIPVHVIWTLIARPQARGQRGYLAALAGLTLPYLPMVVWQWQMLVSATRMTGFTFTPLDAMLGSLLLNHSRGFAPTPVLWLMAPLYFLLGAGFFLGITEIGSRWTGRNRPADEEQAGWTLAPWRRWLLLASWLVLPVIFIYGLSLRQPVFTERYIIWIAPAAMMFVALGITVLARSADRWGPAVTTILLIYLLSLWGFLGLQQKQLVIKYDLRNSAGYIHRQRDPQQLLILQIPHMEWSYRYYSSDFGPRPFDGSDPRLGVWAKGIYTNWGEPDEPARASVATQMEQLTQGHRNIWVLLSEVEMWDQRRLMDEWLAAHGRIIEQVDFPGARVVRYELLD